MTSLLGLLLLVVVAGGAGFVWLLAWSYRAVSGISGASDPPGNLIVAWWLAVAWIRHGAGVR